MHYWHSLPIPESVHSRAVLAFGSVSGLAFSFTMPTPQGIATGLASIGVGVGACWAAIILQTGKARAEAWKVEAEARKGTCQEELERARERVQELTAWKESAKDEMSGNRKEIEGLRTDIAALRHDFSEMAHQYLIFREFAAPKGPPR